MKKNFLLNVVMLCCALFVGTSAWAKTEDGEAAAKSEPVSANEEELLNKILSKLPKVSGYIQTGYNYNRSEYNRKYPVIFRPVIIMEIRTGITDLLSS